MTEAGRLAAELMTAGGRADPYPIYRRLHEHGPVSAVPGGVLVVGYAAAESALRDPRMLVEDAGHLDSVIPSWRDHASRRLLGRSMIFVDGEAHGRMRRLVGLSFTARQVDRLRPTVEKWIVVLLNRLGALAADGPVDVIGEFAYQLPVNVVCDLLGVPEADRAGFRQPIAQLAGAVEPGWMYADLTLADAAATELAGYFADLLAQRRTQPRDDLLSAMISANDGDDALTDDELVANAVFLLLAGFETTIGLLGNGLMTLMERPELTRRLRARPELAPAFVAEIARYDAPVQLTVRRAAADLVLDDVLLPAGSAALIAIGAANRDPSRFDRPDDFDPDRLDNQALSFGSGRHRCLGARLASLEARLAFPMLVERFPDLALAAPPTRLDRLNLRAYATLPLTLGSAATEGLRPAAASPPPPRTQSANVR